LNDILEYICMKLSQLRTFVSIADSGGFARAASRLRLTQSAASRQIAALENELDVLLFDRIGRRVLLTSEGGDLLKRARKLLAEADALGERAKVLKGGDSGTLRVSARPQVIENLLAPFLPRYLSDSPGVEVQLIETSGDQRVSQLDRGEIHLALMAYGIERFHSRLLYPIHVLAVTSPDHRLRRNAVLEISELADERLLILTREFGARSWFDAACDNARITARVILESNSPQTIMALARVGYGVAIVPSNVHAVPSPARAIPLLHRGQCVGRWSVIAWNPQRFFAPYAKRFVDELADEAKRAYPGHGLTRRTPPLPRPK
jgi:LysR family transcriptional regulator, cyn operon transcriptional activator